MNLKNKIYNDTIQVAEVESHVVYAIEVVDAYDDEPVGSLNVTATREGIIDFLTAVSDEAVDPIIEAVEEDLDEDYEVSSVEIVLIVTEFLYEDGSSLDIMHLPNGEVHTNAFTADENMELFLQSLLKGNV